MKSRKVRKNFVVKVGPNPPVEDEGSILERFYEGLTSEETDTPLVLFHSSVYYTRAALRYNGHDMSLRDTHILMYKEGMLPAEEYGLSRWFVRKYKIK